MPENKIQQQVDKNMVRAGLFRIGFLAVAITFGCLGMWNWVALVVTFYLASAVADAVFSVSNALFSLTAVMTLALARQR